ncbi:MAG: S-methyl-5'-thioadenosine phosphorylase [Candidatus Omnitrophica bacterium]|nr:S-methyl-5'-thioadenosine phosphorylase [Candidatus Omnitrophota bacterium]
MAKIGVIGGSGLYDLDGLSREEWIEVKTPFGEPSDKFLLAELEGKEIVFLPRHGRGHKISPSKINYRANIYGMKRLGVERIISVTACGSLKEQFKPLDFVVPDQFVDRTSQARKDTFFDGDMIVHVSFAEPVCKDLAEIMYQQIVEMNLTVHSGGTYLNMEGPQFSTLAESNLYRSWGMDVIGMTNLTEARLAREAEICYVTLAAVTDYDCWHESHETVTVDIILDNLGKNVQNAKKILKTVIPRIPEERNCPCREALKYSIATNLESISKKTKKKLGIIIKNYI